LPFPNIDPVLVQIGPVAIRWYALAYVAGILLGWRYAVGLTRNLRLWRGTAPTADEKQVDDLVLWITLGVIVGGRLGYVLFYKPALIWTDPLEIVRTWNGGMSFHGGLIGVTLALVGFAVGHRINLLRLADLTAPAVPIGLFFGRIANFINGELFGRVSDVPWAVVFPEGGPEPRHPSQLYEAGLEGLVLFTVMTWFAWRPREPGSDGRLAGIFLIGYGLARSFAELFRQPDAHLGYLVGGLTMGQLLSLPMIVLGALLVLRSHGRARASLERS
jgi:phosphatidylglycerol:prolipoprotein diacylglycerol transferase